MDTNILSPLLRGGGDADLGAPGPIGDKTPDTAKFTQVSIPDAADATLSGTPVVFTIYDDSGTPYYIKAYPAKA